MYSTLDNGYDGIQVHCFELGGYNRRDVLPIEEAGIPKDCILATKYFLDEKNDLDKYVYILIRNGVYINWFFKLEDIRGNFPIYEDDVASKYNWLIPNIYI